LEPQGARYDRFSDFDPYTGRFFLVDFSKNEKKCLKSGSKWAYLVQNFSLIIFMKSILVILVPPTHKLAKMAEKSPNFGLIFHETGTEIEKSGSLVKILYLFSF